MDTDQKPIRITKLVQTCGACPAQWDAWDEDGTYYYIRYRSGWLSVARSKGQTGGEDLLFGEQIGDDLDGWIDWETVKAITGLFE